MLGSSDESLAQNVPEMYLEPIRYTFSEPDFSVLDKPSKPPRPEAPSALSPTMQNGNGRLSSSDDPFSNPSVSPAEANNLFNNDDAFAAFNNKTPGVSPRHDGRNYSFLFLFCMSLSFIYLCCRIPLTHSIALVHLDLYPGPPVPSPVISRHPILSVMIKILLLHLEPGLPVNS